METNLPTHRAPTHPGEMLLEEYIKPLALTQTEVAQRLGISFPRLNEILNGKRPVTIDTALRLAQLFNASAAFWLNLQRDWDLWHALQAPDPAIARIKPLKAGVA